MKEIKITVAAGSVAKASVAKVQPAASPRVGIDALSTGPTPPAALLINTPAVVSDFVDVSTSPAVSTSQGVQDAEVAKNGAVYAYIRVSSRDQNEARQVAAMLEFGIAPSNMYMDKQSGKDFQRPAYIRLLAALQPGDVLVVKSIDRLGRNYEEILEQWRVITKEKQAAIVVLDMPLLDTRNSRDLTGTLIADIVLQLLSYVAETERSFIKQRQREGIAAAKARGQRFGRPCKQKPDNFADVLAMWKEGSISAAEAGRRLGVSHVTFLRWAKE